jgi:copper transport protein
MTGTRVIGLPGPAPSRPRVRARLAAGLAALLGLLGLMLAGAESASAHAALLSTTPAQGSVVRTAPGSVVLHFSEQVTLPADALRVFDPAGKRVDSGATGHAGSDQATARVALKSGLAQGSYTVSWRAVSADTHPVSGAWTFSVGHSSSTASVPGEQAPTGSPAVGALYGASRFVSYAAYALLVGAGVLVLLCWPRGIALRGVQRTLLTGWAALLAGTVAQLLLRGPYEQASGMGRVLDLSLVQQTLGERLGTLLMVRVLLLAAAGVVLALMPPGLERPHGRRWLGAAGGAVAVCLAATWALADHASVGMQAGLAIPLDIVHLLAMAGWLGGLTALVVGLRRPESGGGADRRVVQRFSTLAFWSMAALVGSGTYQAWRGLGSWSAFTGTQYGRLLLIKLGCVAVVLGAAYLSRSWTARLREAPEPTAHEPALVEPPEAEPPEAASTPVPAAEGGERAAQLARQRQAVADASRRRSLQAAPARGMLVRSLLLEALFAVAVLVVTTLLTNTAPGRAVTEQASVSAPGQSAPGRSGPVRTTLSYDTGGSEAGASGKVNIEIDPGRTGADTVHAYVVGGDGKPVDVPELDLSLTLPARRLGPLPVKVEKVDLGHWSATGVQIPMTGEWQLAVTVRSSAIDEVTRTALVRIG